MSDKPDFRRAFGMLGGFRKHVRDKAEKQKRRRIITNGKEVVTGCTICGTAWKPIIQTAETPALGHCTKCSELLATGHYAVVTIGQHAFIKCDEMRKDLAGKVIQVKPENFEKIKKLYESKKNGTDQPPAGAAG